MGGHRLLFCIFSFEYPRLVQFVTESHFRAGYEKGDGVVYEQPIITLSPCCQVPLIHFGLYGETACFHSQQIHYTENHNA